MNNFIKKSFHIERLGTPTAKSPVQTLKRNIWPGLIICAIIGLACMIEGVYFPALSANLLAILLGFAARNLLSIPETLEPGIGVAAKRLLRWGVALLGLQVSLSTVLGLGWGVIITDICAVSITFVATFFLGRLLGIDEDLVTLIASGFSICGAAAVAGIQGTVKATEEKVAAAVALVVLFGTIMIGVGPLIYHLLGMSLGNGATLIGGSTHEVAQAAAAAGIAGGGALLTTAILVKLFRVALLAPVVFLLGIFRRKEVEIIDKHELYQEGTKVKRPALLPLFVVGFIILMFIATLNVIPKPIAANIKLLQQFFLTTAMFALGLGVHIKSLRKLGFKPLLLGLFSTIIIILVVLVCISLGLGARI
ncbi:putative sulfate exporter family transporter [Lactococcus allomyrinae]|uniref:Putative sulfate exporter family transporter n=1 Tax=Lactococcus allomyrinae TaxID=2419773 RepID=A0A387BHV4_9LACT|nr:putative sulfate exporter family transporter [Lactococcus allomyrinae]